MKEDNKNRDDKTCFLMSVPGRTIVPAQLKTYTFAFSIFVTIFKNNVDF